MYKTKCSDDTLENRCTNGKHIKYSTFVGYIEDVAEKGFFT